MEENRKRLQGRPNLGKTQTIKDRKVDVYLPTEELMEDWKRMADSADLSLSRYIVEVVERHRRHISEKPEPSKEVVKKMEEMEKDFVSLQSRYDTLDLAFKRTEAELSRMSAEYRKALLNAVDSDTAKGIIQVFTESPGRTLEYSEIMGRTGIEQGDSERIVAWTFAKDFLIYVGVLEHAGMAELRWKHPNMRKRPSTNARKARAEHRARKHP